MKIQSILLCFLVFFVCYSCVETKRKKRIDDQKRLKELCRMQRESNASDGTALELHAYFDLSLENKTFACLKVSTCHSTPVCFITTHSYLKNKSVNDTTAWQDLITFIQKDRKIEPIYDTAMSGWNGDKYKAFSDYMENKPAIYRMCRDATVYRFVINDNNSSNRTNTNVNRAINSSASNENGNATQNHPLNNTNSATTLCPLFKRKNRHTRKGKAMKTKRVGRSKQNRTSDNFFECQGFDCPCVRICVDQGRMGQGKTVQGKTGQGRTGQGRTGQGRTGQGRTGQGRTGQGRTGQGRTGQGRTGQGRTGQGRTGQGRTGQGRTGQRRTGQGRTGQGRTGQRRTGQGRTGQRRTSQRRTGQRRTSQRRTGQGRTGHGKTGQGRIGQGGLNQVRMSQGQNRRSFSECPTFRIICTFNCGSDTILVPQHQTPPQTHRRPKRPRRQRKKNKRKPKPKKIQKRRNKGKSRKNTGK